MSDLPAPFAILLGPLPTFVRLELTRLLQCQGDLHIAGVASSSAELVTMARRLRPGLVIVGENQLLDLGHLARHYSVPVLVYSTTPLLLGALREVARWRVYDVIKPMPSASQPGFYEWQQALLAKVRAARPHDYSFARAARLTQEALLSLPPSSLVVIGASTGGSAAVETLVRGLPVALACAVIIAVHLPASFTHSLVERLGRATALPVAIGGIRTPVEAGKIILAPGGNNLIVRKSSRGHRSAWQTDFSDEAVAGYDEPSIDLLMRSAAGVAGRNALGVVLTGLGHDGTLGAQAIREAGGTVVAQDEATSAVFGMPKSVIRAGFADGVLPLPEISGFIRRHTAQLRAKPAFPVSAPLHAA